MKLTSIARFYDPLEAEIAAGLLRASEVECVISGEAAGAVFPVRLGRMGRIEILVRPEDVSRAKRLLAGRGDEPHGNDSSNH